MMNSVWSKYRPTHYATPCPSCSKRAILTETLNDGESTCKYYGICVCGTSINLDFTPSPTDECAFDRMDDVPVSVHGLAHLLRAIEANDAKYEQRAWLVPFAVSVAIRVGFHAGFRIDPEYRDWPVAYIELPHGQVTWHLSPHVTVWDGHTTDEKYRRIDEFCQQSARRE